MPCIPGQPYIGTAEQNLNILVGTGADASFDVEGSEVIQLPGLYDHPRHSGKISSDTLRTDSGKPQVIAVSR